MAACSSITLLQPWALAAAAIPPYRRASAATSRRGSSPPGFPANVVPAAEW